jgi:hypothetical protein
MRFFNLLAAVALAAFATAARTPQSVAALKSIEQEELDLEFEALNVRLLFIYSWYLEL